ALLRELPQCRKYRRCVKIEPRGRTFRSDIRRALPRGFRAVCVPVPTGKPLRNWFQRAGCRIRGLSVWEFDFSFFCLVTKPLLVVRRRRGQTLPVYFPALHGNAPASAIDAM